MATAIGAFSYLSLVRGFVAAAEGLGQETVAPAFFFGMATVPLAFIALAFISRHRSAPMAVLGAMGLFLVVGLAVGLLTPALGIVGGFSAGAVLALRRDDDHRLGIRILAAVLAVVYTLIVMMISVPLGVFTGAFMPFIAVGFADQYTEHVAEVRREREADSQLPDRSESAK